jgi:hypothetical protein
MTAPRTNSASYDTGYGKPPRRTQFKKGQSGNPGGRPRRPQIERLKELALYEAYRTIIVTEDGHAVPLSAIRAALRSQLQLAAGGNVRAQCAMLAMIKDLEWEQAVKAQSEAIWGRATRDDDADDDDVDGDDGDAGPAQQADAIGPDGGRRQEARQQAAAPPSSADGAPRPENVAAPRATKAVRNRAARNAAPKGQRMKRGRPARTAAARKATRKVASRATRRAARRAPPARVASPGLPRAGLRSADPLPHEAEKLKIPC